MRWLLLSLLLAGCGHHHGHSDDGYVRVQAFTSQQEVTVGGSAVLRGHYDYQGVTIESHSWAVLYGPAEPRMAAFQSEYVTATFLTAGVYGIAYRVYWYDWEGRFHESEDVLEINVLPQATG